MPTISFFQWGFGLDLRKGASTADANRLRVLKNAFITDGKTIRKRNGFTKVGTLSAGTVGLFAGLGQLNTFQIPVPGRPLVAHSPGLRVANHALQDAVGIYDPTETAKLAGVLAVEPFNGALYVVAQHWDNHVTLGPVRVVRHHYLDGNVGGTFVPDAPTAAGITKTASKIWAAVGDVVRYCATNDPRDWTTAEDAGFLPVGLNQSGSKESVTVGEYENRLVVFFSDAAQVWAVDPDPALNKYLNRVDTGTRLTYAHANMASDVFFVSPAGVRTITRQASTESLIDSDVGSPIDRSLLRGDLLDLSKVKAQYVRSTGQLWLYAGADVLVFTFSRSSKISAWSVYEFPFAIDFLDELDTVLYARSGDDLYRLDAEAWTDNGQPFEVLVETPFVDFKGPGVDKQILAVDAVFTGTGDVSHRFDPRVPELVTSPPITITGDTQPGNLYPVELITTNLATVIRNFDDKEFEVHSFSYNYAPLR